MYLSELEEGILSKDQIHKILFGDISDDGEHCDYVFVPSSNTSNKYRTPAVIELFHQGRSPKVPFSGGDNGEFIESESMRTFALERNVPENAILIEPFSTNTKENVIESLDVLEKYIGLKNIKRILICTAFYHMREMSSDIS